MVPRGAFEGLSPWSQVANVVAAIEEVDPSWSETLLIVTSHHGALCTCFKQSKQG